MPRGGKRENSGRKPGSVTVRNREIAEEAVAKGVTPLEVMLSNMRFYHEAAEKALTQLLEGLATPEEIVQEHAPQEPDPTKPPPNNIDAFRVMLALRDKAGEAAKDAAPYLHARITPTDGRRKEDEAVPLAERLKAYAQRETTTGNVLALKKRS